MSTRYFSTALGVASVSWNDHGLTRFHLPEENAKLPGGAFVHAPPEIEHLIAHAQEHFAGKPHDYVEIQLDLFYDYRTNIPLYPQWQAYFRKYKPPMLIVWGKNDEIFIAAGAQPFKRDIPDVEIHMFDTGHFALETNGPEIAELIRGFLGRSVPAGADSQAALH